MAQSSGEWPGARTTFREGLEEGTGRVEEDGAMEALERTFVGGTRSMDAAEGVGRRTVPLFGRGGGGMELKLGDFSLGGSGIGG